MSFPGCAMGFAEKLRVRPHRLPRRPSRHLARVLPDLSERIVRYRSNGSFVHSQHR